MGDVPRRLYLAGPMSGHPQHNFPLFNQAATLLREQGFEVFNPAENKDDGVLRSRAFYMWRDIPALMNSEAIAVLPGWHESRGASLEMWIAVDLDIPAFDCKLQDGAIALEPLEELPNLRLPFIVESRRAGTQCGGEYHDALSQATGATGGSSASAYPQDTRDTGRQAASGTPSVPTYVGTRHAE